MLLQNCSSEFKSLVYKRYVDDTVLHFHSKHHKKSFWIVNINTSDSCPRSKEKTKPTFSRVFTNFKSIIPKSFKYSLLFTLLHRAFNFCSIFEHFRQEFDKLQTIFKNDSYPKSFVNYYIKSYLDKDFTKKEVVLKVSQKVLTYAPFFLLGKKAMQLKTHFVYPVENNLKFCKLKVIYKWSCKTICCSVTKIHLIKRLSWPCL